MTTSPGYQVRWWYLPSWLGLDAPFVVTTWTVAIGLSTGERIRPDSILALWSTVWLIYLIDRLYDVASCQDWSRAPGRMAFGRDYRWLLLAATIVPAAILASVVYSGHLPRDVVPRGAGVAACFFLYIVLFVRSTGFTKKLPGKEIAVGLFFALGAFAVIGLTRNLLTYYAVLCALVAFNCLLISAKDVEYDTLNDKAGAGSWWPHLDRDLYGLGVLLLVLISLSPLLGVTTSFAAVSVSSIVLMLLLHRRSRKLSADTVRALADFCLLTPWVLFVWLAISGRR